MFCSRIKEALQDFIIFIPSNLIYDENCVTDRNSIAILTRSCAKNQCNLVLELILKGSNETDTIINEANNFEDDENCDNKKYKLVLQFFVSHEFELSKIN